MKQRKSETHLIVSSCYLGTSPDILGVFSQVAKHYKASVTHLGPTVSEKEIKEYKALSSRLAKGEVALETKDGAAYMNAQARLEALEERLSELRVSESARVAELTKYFKKVRMVTPEDMSLPNLKARMKGKAEIVHGGLGLTKYLFLSPVPMKGERASQSSVSNVSLAYLKGHGGKSWIVAHPVPSVDCLPKPGLNEAYNYWNVGSLRHPPLFPSHTRNQYEFAHMPCAVLVVIDKENGEFHARQLHVDLRPSDKTAMVLDDGLVFTMDGVSEAPSSDRCTFSTDDHAPYQHPGVLASLRATNFVFKPATFVNGGDAADFESVNRHTKELPRQRENLRLIDDLKSLRRLLDAQVNVPSIKEKVLIDSNHHDWLTLFVDENPALVGLVDWPTLANSMFSDWNMLLRSHGENKIFYFGDLPIRHGDKDGKLSRAEKIFPSGKYLCGHFHQFNAYRRAVRQGCGAKLGPAYIGNEVNAWQSQMSTITRHQGITAVAPKIVLHDKVRPVSRFAYQDKIFEVDFYIIPEVD